MRLAGRWARRAVRFEVEIRVLYLASRDPRVPWYAKAVAACVVGYALSPIDLIPDFLPVVGHLDDAIVIRLGLLLARRMIPAALQDEYRRKAQEAAARDRPRIVGFLVAVLVAWILALVLLVYLLVRWIRRR